MDTLEAIRASNRRLDSALPARLIAVFVGVTSRIGEASMKQLAKHANAAWAPASFCEKRGQTVSGDQIKEISINLTLLRVGTHHWHRDQGGPSLLRSIDILLPASPRRESRDLLPKGHLCFNRLMTMFAGGKERSNSQTTFPVGRFPAKGLS
ncbi:hypothetical protein ETB97_006803 [Aspergillus alliaceus]|uniref:Uncharacterized protein n=1 Tax=Petromyces alliaceus TaxID=209559 RepID=A0A5N6FZS5_PETAA|nr:uncharacterized protein BDW43DRAFT_309332 [Aspergillus alliaceus]KAB8235468.1 hypothetical protein BDW43DRAFT_309332 [Aspergillus alliaceus]KAF5866959.1 hypothetical protein ETB97_006803 [Aspergillus burnettii]